MDKLKPCPFCNGKAGVYEFYTLYKAQCNCCGCGTLQRKSKEQAIEAWNRRVKED